VATRVAADHGMATCSNELRMGETMLPVKNLGKRSPTRSRARRRSGSTLVEAALALLPMLAFFFGIVDVSFAVFVKNTLLFAVRQGVRYAVTSQTMTGLGQDASIKSAVRTYSAGLVDALSPNQDGSSHITITYYDPVTLAAVTGANSNIGGNIVVVSISGLSWAWMFPLWHNNQALQFGVASADIMEATPVGGAPAR
jgi:Flp pilus assembly protein TadG